MDKLKMESPDLTETNIRKIAELFPDVVTETKGEDGRLRKAIDFGKLKFILSADKEKVEVVEDDSECYEFTWVGKKKALMEVGAPIRKTLRPCVEESRDWETTQNLYIEGDNLEVLKLLQESYLGKVKMIYIDPPYNTGKDFIYKDNFTQSREEYEEELGMYDEEGNRLFQNTETNGRFHSDWCSMIYPRLLLARNLLTEDGVIFISIDDNEVANLRKICDEVFGESNFVGNVIWERAFAPKNDAKYFSDSHDYILVYAKTIDDFVIGKLERTEEANNRYTNLDDDPRGIWTSGDLTVKTYSASYDYPITTPNGTMVYPSHGSCWRVSKERFQELVADNRIWFGQDGGNVPRLKRFLSEVQDGMTPISIWYNKDVGHNQEGRQELKKLFDNKGYFDGPKPIRLLQRMLHIANTREDSLILDFFSGSSTTAHAVMQLNAEDGGHRKFIMVQLPEQCGEGSEAAKAGYKTICEIGKERIRRAGNKIVEENKDKEGIDKLDVGFRVFKLDSTNMKEVYYAANEYTQANLLDLISNIKEDRSDLDLLYGCLIDWGVSLDLPHRQEEINGFTVHFVNETDLVACFEEHISEETIRTIAGYHPLRVVFRDASFQDSADRINVTEIFKAISPDTTVRVI